jgi:hypothetical protein
VIFISRKKKINQPLNNFNMGCGCKNSSNTNATPQSQPTQQTVQKPNQQTVQETIQKTIEKYYTVKKGK